ncbi:MAG TPA: hypothetical protein VHE37_12285 [Nevskiaceae bacterium]|nr:hypothetical protein [Nevskiaceae bacterium]
MAATLPASAWAFGVDEAEVLSRYGAPLHARVPISLGDGDRIEGPDELSVRVLRTEGSADTPYSYSEDSIEASVAGSGRDLWVELRGKRPLREPLLLLQLEVRSGYTRLTRELPLMLDPPETSAPSAPLRARAVAEAPLPVLSPAPAPVAAIALTPAPPAAESVAEPSHAHTSASRRMHHPRARAAAAQGEDRGLHLAGWNAQSYTQATQPLPMFQLDEHFASLSELSPAPEPADAMAAAAAPVAPAATQAGGAAPAAAPAPAIAPALTPPADTQPSSRGLWWWLLAVGLVAAYAVRRMRLAPRAVPPSRRARGVAGSDAARAEAPVPAAEAAHSAVEDATQPLRRRMAELARNIPSTDTAGLRKLQLVEAYLDLGKLAQAQAMLSELEAEKIRTERPAITLVKG